VKKGNAMKDVHTTGDEWNTKKKTSSSGEGERTIYAVRRESADPFGEMYRCEDAMEGTGKFIFADGTVQEGNFQGNQFLG